MKGYHTKEIDEKIGHLIDPKSNYGFMAVNSLRISNDKQLYDYMEAMRVENNPACRGYLLDLLKNVPDKKNLIFEK